MFQNLKILSLKKSRNVNYFPNTIEKVIFHLNELIGESSWWESVPTIRRNSALRSKKFITSRQCHTDHDEIQIKIQRQMEIPWKTVQRRRGLEVAARQGEGTLGSHHFGRLRWSHFHYFFIIIVIIIINYCKLNLIYLLPARLNAG